MGKARKKVDLTIVSLIVAAMMLVPLFLYVGGYLWLGSVEKGIRIPAQVPVVSRTYGNRWQADIFRPVGKVEAWLFRPEVEIDHAGLHAYP